MMAVMLAVSNQILEHNGVFLPYIHAYLDDLLCFPITLTLGLAAYRWLWPHYQLNKWHIWPLFLFYAFYFEGYLPTKSTLYTRDWADVLAYFIGILIFLKWINPQPKINTEKVGA